MKYQKIAFIGFILFLLSIGPVAHAFASDGANGENDGLSVAASQEPNLFELKGMGLRLIYSTTGLGGQPELTVEDKRGTVTFQGEEIRLLKSEVGLQITVTLEQVPDLLTKTLTLILPEINPVRTGTPFLTNAIITIHRTSIGGPDLVKGVLQTYHIKPLRGIARTVVF